MAGGVAAAVWAAQQPLDKRVFRSAYDDVELLGKLLTRGPRWPLIGLALHLQNGALAGAAYAHAKPFLPGPAVGRALLLGLGENFALWPLGRLIDRHHPAAKDIPRFRRNRRALAQATWRHALFGLVLEGLEHRLNAGRHEEPPPVPVSSNGHGDLEAAAAAAPAAA